MPPTRSLPHPIYVSTELANIPFRFRRKSLSEDDLPNPDYYLLPPSLSPSRSFSMSSSPPSSPATLNTSPTRSHFDTARIHPASSPTHPTSYHAYGYSRGLSYSGPSDHDLPPTQFKRNLPNSHSHHPIIYPPNPIRSTFSPLSTDRHSLQPSCSSVSQNTPVHDEEEDDIEDYGFALDLDDILASSSPTRRISFTTSSERDRPFVRPPVKPRSRAFPKAAGTRPHPFSPITSTTPAELRTHPREVQCDSTRTSAAPADIPPPLARPRTPIRPRSLPRHVATATATATANANADLDDALPPSSPIPSPASSSPLCTPSARAPRPPDSGCGSDSSPTVRPASPGDLRYLDADAGADSDLTLPPSSPDRGESDHVPSTPVSVPARYAEDAGMAMDTDADADLDLADLVASPPSPTLDALRITSRVSVRALLNPAPVSVPAPAPPRTFAFAFALGPAPEAVPVADGEDDDEVLPQLEMPIDDETDTTQVEAAAEVEVEVEVKAETEAETEAKAEGENADETTKMVVVSIPDGDVTPLVLPETSEEIVVPVDALGVGVPDADVALGEPDADVGEEGMVMATEIRVQIAEPAGPELALALEPSSEPASEREREACPVPIAPAQPVTSRRSSCAPSRARTPHAAQIQSQETPSSPLSPTPSSIADADVDVDIEMQTECDAEPPAPTLAVSLPVVTPISTPVAGPSRSASDSNSRVPSPAHPTRPKDAVEQPPRKKMRRDGDADVSHATAAVKPKVKAKRSRTPTFTDSESEGDGDGEKAVLKPRKKPTAAANRQEDVAKAKLVHQHKKRPRAVLSDDETESDAPAAPVPVPVRAPASTSSLPLAAKKRDGDKEPRERKKEKPKKSRAKAKEPQADLELENEPLHPHPHPHASTSNVAHAKQQQPAKSSSLSISAAPPKSATNIARPELPLPELSPLDVHGHAHGSQLSESLSKPPRLAQDPGPDPDRTSADATSAKTKTKPCATPTGKAKAKAPRDHAAEIEAEADALVAAFELPLPAPELEGMLIETLATARASSLSSSALFGALMAARPALRDMPVPALKDAKPEDDASEKDADAKTQSKGRGAGAKADTASRRAWVPALEAVLEAGWRRSGVFGKIVNSGTDLANHALALEARWFYDPDQDADADRAALVRTMMRRPGKRSETKKAKHYYWRPLPKISRWDDEDEL